MPRTPEENKVRQEAEILAGKEIGHTPEIKGVTLDDRCVCSCGWQSNQHWDGREHAYAEWVDHLKKQGATIPYPN